MSVADSTITGNYASGGGGGIANSGSPVITGSAIFRELVPVRVSLGVSSIMAEVR